MIHAITMIAIIVSINITDTTTPITRRLLAQTALNIYIESVNESVLKGYRIQVVRM